MNIYVGNLSWQMTDEELSAFIDNGITQANARGPKDMGKLMGLLSKSAEGRVEGRRLADEVKRRLTQSVTDPDKVGDATNL